MKYMKLVVSAAILASVHLAAAQDQNSVSATTEPGKASVSGAKKVTATVEKIDAATRTVTLKRHDGKVVDIQLGPEARNFDQLKVGDVVTAVYQEALTLSLKKGGNGQTSMQETPSIERSAVGEKPGGKVAREVKVTANVVAVDERAHTVTVKGPEGGLMDLQVNDPAQLQNVKPGDQVEAVYTEALAISVKPAQSK
ncbi:MAG TPA: hypothetical protein VL689_13910 [Paraburkholderia sp.]|jgi:Cu/Ag efflux protein CusF|nr:hypothetical protein [Paraburkholderia sp.]